MCQCHLSVLDCYWPVMIAWDGTGAQADAVVAQVLCYRVSVWGLLQSADPEWEAAVELGEAAGCVAYSKANNVPQVCAALHGNLASLGAAHFKPQHTKAPG